MSRSDTKSKRGKAAKKAARKPPPRWRRYLVQAELELPPPSSAAGTATRSGSGDDDDERAVVSLRWWQTRARVCRVRRGLCLAARHHGVVAISLRHGSGICAGRPRERTKTDATGFEQRARPAHRTESAQLVRRAGCLVARA